MKTTVEIPDALFREAKEHAARHGVSLRAIITQGIREVVQSGPKKRKFRLKTITMKGQGLAEEMDWPTIRARIYEGRGE